MDALSLRLENACRIILEFMPRKNKKEEKRTQAVVTVNIPTLELEDERETNPRTKIAVKSAIRPRIKPIEWILARTVIATIRRRQGLHYTRHHRSF